MEVHSTPILDTFLLLISVGPTTKSSRGEATSGARGTSSSIRASGRTATCSPSASLGRSGGQLSRLQQVVFLARDVQMVSMSRLVTFTTGEAIMSYLKEAAEEQGLMEKIRFNWSTIRTFTFHS